MHLCRAPPDRPATRQQHFLPLLKSCSYPHLLLPQGSLPSLGPQTLESENMSPMARSPLLQVGSSMSDVSGHAQTPGWHRGTAPSPCKSQKAQLSYFFFKLRCNSHTLKLTILKYTIQRLLIYSQDCATITTT